MPLEPFTSTCIISLTPSHRKGINKSTKNTHAYKINLKIIAKVITK